MTEHKNFPFRVNLLGVLLVWGTTFMGAICVRVNLLGSKYVKLTYSINLSLSFCVCVCVCVSTCPEVKRPNKNRVHVDDTDFLRKVSHSMKQKIMIQCIN